MRRILLVVILLLPAVRVDAFTINFDAPQSVSTVTTIGDFTYNPTDNVVMTKDLP
jgi:hypothetical protein